MSEVENIKSAYEKRSSRASVYLRLGRNFYYILYSEFERELLLSKIIRERFSLIPGLKILEVGSGFGNNLLFFKRTGANWSDITANELLSGRIAYLQEQFPMVRLLPGDFSSLVVNEKYDIIYQSMVFSSVLDKDMKVIMAAKMWELLRQDGIILWYDFKFDNPRNKDVKGIRKSEVKKLFPEAENIKFYDITLLPPIGRFVGRFYNFFNTVFPFLRSHYVAVIYK